MRKGLIVLAALVAIIAIVVVVRVLTFDEMVEAGAQPYFVPVIVTPSVQLAAGQMLLYKITNLMPQPVNVRLAIYNDREGVPGTYEDFMAIRGGHTVSHVYEPPKHILTLGSTKVEVPEAVRAEFVPVPGDDPGAIRRVVANVQLIRIQPATANGTPALEPPIGVPLERCTFEPRGFTPVHTGHRYMWNCAPQMYPYDMKWLKPGMVPAGQRPAASD